MNCVLALSPSEAHGSRRCWCRHRPKNLSARATRFCCEFGNKDRAPIHRQRQVGLELEPKRHAAEAVDLPGGINYL